MDAKLKKGDILHFPFGGHRKDYFYISECNEDDRYSLVRIVDGEGFFSSTLIIDDFETGRVVFITDAFRQHEN